MELSERPWRSVLYVPGSRPRAIAKVRSLPVDAIIFDLEDAVAPDEKPAARETLAREIATGGFGPRALIVRINGLGTDWGETDALAAGEMNCDAVLLPKVERTDQLDALAGLLPGTPLWAMMETPAGCLNAASIAAHPALKGLVMGTNELAKELNARVRRDRFALMAGLQACLLAARAHGVVCIDGVYNAFRDTDGLRAECEQGRDLGMDGKTLVHPDQVSVANEVFGPSDEELDLSRRQIEAFEQARRSGQGVAVVDGRIVENLHVATARATLAKARVIRELEGA